MLYCIKPITNNKNPTHVLKKKNRIMKLTYRVNMWDIFVKVCSVYYC